MPVCIPLTLEQAAALEAAGGVIHSGPHNTEAECLEACAPIPEHDLIGGGAGAGLVPAEYAPPPAFSPTDIAGLMGWWDANVGVFEDAAMSTAATDDADPVGGWQDQSGLAQHLTQATSARRPTLQVAERNGLDVLQFDGTDDCIFSDTASGFASGNDVPFSMFLVFRMTGEVGRTLASLRRPTASDQPIHELRSFESPAGYRIVRSSNTQGIIGVESGHGLDTDWQYALVIFHGTTITLRMLGTTVINGAALDRNSTTLGRFVLGAILTIAGTTTAAAPCMIAECGLYDSALAGTDITDLETYLVDKWGF